MNKIEAAERLAEAVEEYKLRVSGLCFSDMVNALAAYRSASVPSDEDLGKVAYIACHDLTNADGWNERTKTRFVRAATAVREWVQRDGLTDEEREAVIALVDCHLANAELRDSILRKLGREPEPVWEWRSEYSWWGLYRQEQLLARVDLDKGGIMAKVWCDATQNQATPQEHTSETWGLAEAKAWCEQQLRNANLKGATDGKQN